MTLTKSQIIEEVRTNNRLTKKQSTDTAEAYWKL